MLQYYLGSVFHDEVDTDNKSVRVINRLGTLQYYICSVLDVKLTLWTKGFD